MSATAKPPPDLLAAWPRTAQWALAFLLAAATVLIGVYAVGSMRWGTQPTRLEQEAARGSRVDLNDADHAYLRQLPGVGDKLADDIERYRGDSGGFRRVDDLANVKGIGPGRLRTLRPQVGVKGEEKMAPSPPPRNRKPASEGTPKRSKKGEALTEPVDVNRATAEQLQKLPGIGPTLAKRIIAERQKKPFGSVDELRRVRGIGPKTLEKLKPFIRVEATGGRGA